MENIIGYLNYKEDISKNFFQKILDNIFFKAECHSLNENKREILINQNIINQKNLEKIIKLNNKNNIKNMIISNKIEIQTDLENLNLLNGKILMKNTIIFLLKFICDCINKDVRCENIYVLIDNDKNKDIIIDLAHEFKSISIVTDNIKKLRRLDRKLSNDEEIITSISNNCKKALKKANIIVNFDYDTRFFEKFNVNRNSIIINLNKEKIKMKNSYQGIIIENIKIDYEDLNNSLIDFKNFDKTIFYESCIFYNKYYEIKDKYCEDKCKIKKIIGSNGEISIPEIKKFYNNLDKCIKKD